MDSATSTKGVRRNVQVFGIRASLSRKPKASVVSGLAYGLLSSWMRAFANAPAVNRGENT